MTVREAYKTLGLDPTSATPEDARTRFRALIRAHHPDGKPADDQARANELTRTIIEACAVLRAHGMLRVGGAPARAAASAASGTAAGRDGGLDDSFGWIDDLFREFARGNAMSVMWPAVGMLVSFDVWMAGWGFGATPRKRVG